MDYRLEDLIDVQLFQDLQDKLNVIYSFPSAIIDNDGNILTATAWQDVCTRFHRTHPECERECKASDRYILEHLDEAKPAVTYRCPHGLVDNATPIVIAGRHLGNFFTGQFFLEKPDLELFRKQARKYGFEEGPYLEAVTRVPVWSEEKLHQYLQFIKGFTEILAGIGYKQLQEIETRKRISETNSALEEMHIFSRQVVEGVEEGIIVYGPDLRYQMWNPYMERLSGLGAAEVLGRQPLDVFPFLKDVGVIERVKQALSGKVLGPVDFPFVTPDGRSGWASDTTAPLVGGDDRIIGAIATVRNITERKRAEQEALRLQAQLTQAQKLESVGRLAGGVAHDFNNMLGVILGNAEMAKELLETNHPVLAGLEEIRKAAERSADLTRQLLAFASRQPVIPRVLDLNTTVEGMLQMIRRMIGENISLSWSPSSRPAAVRIDPSQVDQIVVNLCLNARDAIAGNGGIAIHTSVTSFEKIPSAEGFGAAPGEYVLLSVEDNGCGMDRETLERLFEPFFTTKRVGQGTGLGLATVYGIVKQNGGVIRVDSEKGRGACIQVYLPLHTGSVLQVQSQGKEPPAESAPVETEIVLLVEDEPAILAVVTRMLRRAGFQVLPAASPSEAISIAEEQPGSIHVLISDVVMPEMNGKDLLERLRSTRPALRHLFMSGYPADIIARHGVLEVGAQFIQKPFTMNQLVCKLRETRGSSADGPAG